MRSLAASMRALAQLFMRSVDFDEVARSFYEGASTAFMHDGRSLGRSQLLWSVDNMRSS